MRCVNCLRIPRIPPCRRLVTNVPRTDDPALNSKAEQINSILKTFANQNDWKIISHPNITGEHLNSSGLHLNLSGTKAFSSDLVSSVKNI